ncbi:hypothetical protein GCM10009733_068380 [Nonomuraea maheshkhaliensis]|uniref:AAA+ ATPase domain-containing protein n=1 Tax=Nonomuraea maheshkhaliensis TaxID=419590 RepID=A0ABN2FXI5_9ACTN
MTYRDAVALLGGPSAITDVLDKASSMALFGLGAIDLFDARAEAVRLGDAFLRRLRDKVKGLSRYDTTQRLAAAHAVIVVTAYLDALAEVDVLRQLTPDDQRRITGTEEIGRSLLSYQAPLPTPAVPFEKLLTIVEGTYASYTVELTRFLAGLECWDRWDETTRSRLDRGLPPRARRRYEELFHRLAADFPEVACWSDRVDHQATRAEVRDLARGLEGIRRQLAAIPATRTPSDRLTALIRSNRAVLGRPSVSSTRTPPGMRIPPLEQGYINPGYRLLPWMSARSPITAEEEWAPLARRHDLDSFFVGHLTQPEATYAPLLVLGQPGAGKSVLTQVLAARLPESEFLPLRVELRDIPADADVLAQIEHGIRATLDEAMSWPEFVHAGRGALPVVLLDGFDELLQATGVNQSDYLERVVRFQEAQAERGRALAVVVTSRTAVADRARIPWGASVIRLEPFDSEQIHQWVGTWNDSNDGYFRERGLQPLPVDRVLAVRNLAGQPLLLLMLALYDADANALRLMNEDLHEAELYERLLQGFAAREIGKARTDLTDEERARAVEDALLRLSVTAFAMFNRGRQWVSEADLDADLRALLPDETSPAQDHGLRRTLTPAESVIGGFFFVRTTQALRDDQRLKTYEFLHATFGEYLVARLVVRELADMAEELAFAGSRRRPARPDDAFLHALLSFAALTVRAPIVDFLRYGLATAVPPDRRALLTRHLCELFAGSLMERPGSPYDAYQPVRAEATLRYATHSANLLLLAVLSAGEPVTGTDLFGTAQPEQANERWRRISRLWHAQLSRAEWDALTRTIRIRHFVSGRSRMMTAAFERDPVIDSRDLAFFTWPDGEDEGRAESPYRIRSSNSVWMREIAFRDDTTLAHLFIALLPYQAEVDDGALGANPRSRVADLLTLLLRRAPDTRAYMRALALPPTRQYVDRVLRQLEVDAHHLPYADVLFILNQAGVWWQPPDRLENVLRVLRSRPNPNPGVLAEMEELLVHWKAKDEAGFWPLPDPEITPVSPGDLTGDGQSEPTPPGIP